MPFKESQETRAELTGLDRAAVLLTVIDDDTAAEVFKRLSRQDAQKLASQMSQLKNVSQPQILGVLDEFSDEIEQLGVVSVHTGDRLRAVLTKAMGEERAGHLLEDIFESDGTTGIDTLNLMEADTVAELIRDEHPQIIATIVVHLDRSQAADVLSHFKDELRNDIVLRIATFSGVQPVALEELTAMLGNMFDGQSVKRSNIGGVHPAAEILNRLASPAEEAALDAVRRYDADLAKRIYDEMFVFDDVLNLDDRSIQRLLAELDSETLGTALKGKDDVLARFTANMASRAAELLREDMEMRGPIRKSKVDSARKEILDVIRRMVDGGEISISREEDEYV